MKCWLKAVYGHLVVFVFAIGAHKGVNQLLNLFYGRTLPDTNSLGEIVRRSVNWKFDI
jgi:hypothetical protein